MRRKFLSGLAAALWGSVLVAQPPVPARELWQFPLGAVLEPAALASEAGTGLWNPASVAMGADSRLQVGVAWLSASVSQNVESFLLGASWRRPSGYTFGISVARAAVGGLVRTESDPTSVGTIDYSSSLISLTLARQVIPHLTVGLSARYRDGRNDLVIGSAIAGDLGLRVDSLTSRHVRIGLSSFLWRPGRERDDRPIFLAAADASIFARKDLPDIRLGYARGATSGGAREHGPFMSAKTGPLEVRGALVITRAYGARDLRARSGLALHLRRYIVGIGREEGIGGLGPLYQFTLSSLVK